MASQLSESVKEKIKLVILDYVTELLRQEREKSNELEARKAKHAEKLRQTRQELDNLFN